MKTFNRFIKNLLLNSFRAYRKANCQHPMAQSQSPKASTLKNVFRYGTPMLAVALVAGCVSSGGAGPSDPAAQGARNAHFQVKHDEITKIAVVLKRPNTPDIDDVIENAFSTVMLRKNYNMVTRGALEAILKEINLQGTGVTDQASAIHVGQIANASHILVVSLNQRPTQSFNKAQVTAQMFDVRTALTVGTSSGSVSNFKLGGVIGEMVNSDPLATVEQAATKTAQALP